MIKNILLIGKTGSGKSTIANVISSTNKFIEGSGTISQTREIQNEKFENNDIEYQIIDTVGIGDTNLSDNEVLDKIAEAVYLAREGIHQIFFVVRNRLDVQQASIYNILKTVIFDDKSTDYTTIIRTEFSNFNNEDLTKKDIDLMINSEENVSEIVKECNNRFIHVNNPTLDISCDECKENSSYEKNKVSCEECLFIIEINKENRKKSNVKLINCLDNYKELEVYIPEKLKNLSGEIVSYMEDKFSKKEEFSNNKKVREFEEIRNLSEIFNNIDNLNNQDNNQVNLLNITNDFNTNSSNSKRSKIRKAFFSFKKKINKEKSLSEQSLSFPEEHLITEDQTASIIKNRDLIEKTIKDIRDWKEIKKLKEQIIELDKKIRDRIRYHILNSRDEINKISGGSQFINLIEKKDDCEERSISDLDKQRKYFEEKLKADGNSTLSLNEINSMLNKFESVLLNLRRKQFQFDEQLLRKWNELGFTFEKIVEWFNLFKEELNLEESQSFHNWLIDKRNFDFNNVEELSLLMKENLKSWLRYYNEEIRWNFNQINLRSRWDGRNEIKEINLNGSKIEGKLDFSDFVSLERLYCYDNRLTEVILPNNNRLEIIHLSNNFLTYLNYQTCNPKFLKELFITNNNFLSTDIKVFEKFINLERLSIGNSDKARIDHNPYAYNRFYGSFEALKDLSKLTYLNIDNTDISSGVEFLSTSVKSLHYSTDLRPYCLLEGIKDELDKKDIENASLVDLQAEYEKVAQLLHEQRIMTSHQVSL